MLCEEKWRLFLVSLAACAANELREISTAAVAPADFRKSLRFNNFHTPSHLKLIGKSGACGNDSPRIRQR